MWVEGTYLYIHIYMLFQKKSNCPENNNTPVNSTCWSSSYADEISNKIQVFIMFVLVVIAIFS